MPASLHARYHQVMTHLHPRGMDAYRGLRADFERRISAALARGQPIDAMMISALRTFPEIAYALAKQILRHRQLAAELCHHPDILYHVLIAEYESCANNLEAYLVGEGQGELIYRLLRWGNFPGRKLIKPFSYYEDWLARDPFWAAQWLSFNPQAVELAEKVAVFSEGARLEDAGAAYAWLASHPEEGAGAYTRIILQDPFYTYLSLLALRQKIDPSLFLRENLTPRWAYHLAFLNSAIPRTLLEDCLITDMGWLVEYLVDATIFDTEPKTVTRLYVESIALNIKDARPTHACCKAFHAWISRLTAYFRSKVSSQNQPPAAASA